MIPSDAPPLPSQASRRRVHRVAVVALLMAGGAGLLAMPGLSSRKSEASSLPAQPPEGADRTLRTRVEALTGAPTRIVWARDVGSGKDTYANGSKLVLMGLDTRRGEGERVLGSKRRNYSRPLFSPDGETVIFSERRKSESKPGQIESTIHAIPWAGGEPQMLRPGYAVEVWQDPATSQTWVYAFTSLRDGLNANPEGYRLVRFPLTNPTGPEEVIREHGLMSGDNIQLNRSGTMASGLLPWPNAGTFEFTSGRFIRYGQGCWPSLAPDDSGVLWVFDGTHENLRFFLPGVDANWRVPMGDLDVLKGKAAYHPRWSNHPQVICFTGPHPARVKEGTGKVSVLLGRLDSSLTRIESTLTLHNTSGDPDCYPDVWVAGGESVSLDPKQIGPEEIRALAASPRPVAEAWKAAQPQLCFVWERSTADNTIDAAKRECSVQPVRHARYGSRFDLLTEGGAFVMDPASADAIRQALSGGVWSFELALTPLRAGPGEPHVIFRAGTGLELQQRDHDLVIRTGGRDWILGAGLSGHQTTHLAVSSAPTPDAAPLAWLNGQGQELRELPPGSPQVLAPSTGSEVLFGAREDGTAPWAGRLETIAFHAAPVDSTQVVGHAAWWKQRLTHLKSVPRTVVRARLLEASPRATPDSIGTYRRSWTSALYEKTALISGPDPGPEFGVAHWTLLDRKAVGGPPGAPGEERELILEPMSAHPQMDSEHGSEEILTEDQPIFLDMAAPGS